MRKPTASVLLAVGLTALEGSPAVAYITAVSPDGGARGTTSTTGGTAYAEDLKCDGYKVKTNYRGGSGSGTLQNGNPDCSGFYTRVSPGYTITSLQACVVKSLYPDNCSGWVS